MAAWQLILYTAANKNDIPQKAHISNSNLAVVSENDYVFLELISDNKLNYEPHIWLSDYKFSTKYDGTVGGKFIYCINFDNFFPYKDREKFSSSFKAEISFKHFEKVFLNSYGRTEIEIEFQDEFEDRNQKVGNLEIISDKLGDLDSLLDYLFEKKYFYWHSISLTKNEASEKDKNKENILWILNNISRQLQNINDIFLPQLYFDKLYKLVPQRRVEYWSDEISITEESLLWMFSNLNKLELTNNYDENRFLLLNKPYKLKEVLTESLQEDTDISENQTVHAFINDINIYLIKSSRFIHEKLQQYNDAKDFKSIIYKSYFNKLLKTIDKLEFDVGSIKNNLDLSIPVSREEFDFLNGSKFESKPHYFFIYQEIVKWIEKKEAIYSPNSLFTGTKDISTLYEVNCLFKVIDSLTLDLNFKQHINSKVKINKYQISTDFIGYEESPLEANYFFQNKNGIKINLYYEQLPDALTTTAKSGRQFRPDFIIEIINNNKPASYIILDAKYKKIGLIENYDYEELCLKYLHGIGPKDGGKFNIVGLIIINPIQNSGIGYYHHGEYSLSGNKTILPIIGRVEVSVKQKQNNWLSNLLKDLLRKGCDIAVE